MPPIDQLVQELRRKDVKLWLDGDNLRCSAPTGVLTHELQLKLKESKPELVAFLRGARRSGAASVPRVRPMPRKGPTPLSFAQEGAWFIDRLQPGVTFNIALSCRLEGTLDLPVLEGCLNQIVRRHEALRTTFGVTEGRPHQVVNPVGKISVTVVDLERPTPIASEAELLSLFVALSKTPFDLERGPLFRMTVARMGPDDHAVLLAIHHSIFDGWSVNIIAGEMSRLYEAVMTGVPADLPPLTMQFADYALWQREALEGELYDQQLDYWKSALAGFTPDLQLASDRAPSATELFVGDALSLEMSPALGRKLRELAQQEGLTIFMLLLAAFKLLLMRYGGQEDIVIGTPIANRSQEEMSGVVGFFVNMLALRTDLSGNPTFRELLQREKHICLAAYGNQELPFGLIVQELVPDRNVANSPLFQAQFSMQEAPGKILELPNIKLKSLFNFSEKFEGLNRMLAYALPAFDPLSLWVIEAPGSFGATLHYRADLFASDTIRRMLNHYRAILEAGVGDPDVRIGDIPLLSARERAEIIREFGSEGKRPASAATVAGLFEAQAGRTPDAVAVVVPPEERNEYAESRLTYRELNESANRLAHYLIDLQLGPEERVGIAMDRSLEMIVAVWAVLKAGLAFVPLDHSHGRERLEYMMSEAKISVLLTRQGTLEVAGAQGIRVVEVDSERVTIDKHPIDNPNLAIDPEQLAYVVYTSGSTGRPKGVMVSHANLAAAYRAWEQSYDLPSKKTHLQMANFAFDVFVGDLTRALCSGARLVLCPRETLLIPDKLFALLRSYSVDCAEFVPAVIRSLLLYLNDHNERLDFMRLIAVGSDRWSPGEYGQLRMVAGEGVSVVNSYGVAEATIDSSFFEDQRFGGAGDAILPVGRPFPGAELYVLDPRLEPVPVGIPGELYLGGAGVARGYFGRPQLTAERFVPHPLGPEPGARLYRTGDRARWRSDRSLEVLGRVDQQIKVRGFRIEPGEVEAVLMEQPGIDQALVIARQDAGSEEKQLVAYLVPEPTWELAARSSEHGSDWQAPLRDALRSRLPDYMVPAFFVLVEAFPLTPNGKVNYRALPPPDASGVAQEELILPQTPTEEALTVIWRRVLGVEILGTNSDFFALGGHSLKASEIVYRIRESMGVELPLRTIFESPTIRGLARAIEQAHAPELSLPPIEPQPRDGQIPLAYAQEGAWFIDQLQPGVPFNIPLPWHLRGDLDVAILERALARVIDRHEALRTTFSSEDGQPFQLIAESIPAPIKVVDLRSNLGDTLARELITRLIHSAGRSFDLERGPLVELNVFRLADEEQVLLFTAHHIVFDGHSVAVLARDLSTFYEAERTGVAPNLPSMPIQYADYALWQRRLLSGDFLESQLAYWAETLADVPAGLNLVTEEKARTENELFAGEAVTKVFSSALSARLRELSKREGVTLFILFMAAYKLLLARYTGQEDLVVGSPVANRSQPETANLIGFCVNMLAFRTDLSGNPTFAELLQRERDVFLGAYSHQELPFGLLVQHLRPDRHLSHSPFFSVGFGLHQAGTQAVQVSQFETSSLQGLDVKTWREELEKRRAEVTPSTD
ncbi:MAG: amino acid adenylation domain-containing protein, partial [Actinomycetota bacterium]